MKASIVKVGVFTHSVLVMIIESAAFALAVNIPFTVLVIMESNAMFIVGNMVRRQAIGKDTQILTSLQIPPLTGIAFTAIIIRISLGLTIAPDKMIYSTKGDGQSKSYGGTYCVTEAIEMNPTAQLGTFCLSQPLSDGGNLRSGNSNNAKNVKHWVQNEERL
jgi:hypothetical protein